MTDTQRERWETKTLQAIRKRLQANLAIFTLMRAEDKREIETQVMVEIEHAVAELPDCRVGETSALHSLGAEADLLGLKLLYDERFDH
jgi:hypothetical protein